MPLAQADVSIVPFLRYCLLGIYGMLTLYHGIVWTGRRHDFRNLSFAALSFSFTAYLLLLILIPDITQRTIPNYVFTILIVATTPFFYYTLNLMPAEVKSFQVRGSGLVVLIGTGSLVYYLATLNNAVTDIFFYSCVLVYAIPANLMGAFFFFRKKMHRDRETLVFYLGFFFLAVSVVFTALFFGFFHQALSELASLIIFNGPFLSILLAFAFGLVKKFNREHADLNELKENLERKVAERTAELEDAHQQKTRLFLNLAHETKTPLTLISNYLHEFSREKSLEFSVIRQNIEKLKTDMVNFLDLEKLERGQVFYDHSKLMDASRLVRMQMLLYDQLAAAQKIRLSHYIGDHICLRMDPLAFERIVNNLVDNALKYNLKRGTVDVSLTAVDATVRLTVTNSGPPIAANQSARIFEPFYQISHEKRNVQGIGMGLAIVKKIVEDVGGTITVSGETDGRVTFSVALPALTVSDTDDIIADFDVTRPEPQVAIELAEPVHDPGRPTVFVVEDNRAMVYYLTKKLDRYNVYWALDGEAALSRIRAIPRPQIIISDVMMDPVNGFEFRDRLVASKKYQDIPFIFLTALSSAADKLKGLGQGAVDYVSKPFLIQELVARIEALLKLAAALSRPNLKKIGRSLLTHLDNQAGPAPAGEPVKKGLKELYAQYGITRRQVEIIALLKIGLERKEICDRLGVSFNTVGTQLARMYARCKVNNKVELINIFS